MTQEYPVVEVSATSSKVMNWKTLEKEVTLRMMKNTAGKTSVVALGRRSACPSHQPHFVTELFDDHRFVVISNRRYNEGTLA